MHVCKTHVAHFLHAVASSKWFRRCDVKRACVACPRGPRTDCCNIVWSKLQVFFGHVSLASQIQSGTDLTKSNVEKNTMTANRRLLEALRRLQPNLSMPPMLVRDGLREVLERNQERRRFTQEDIEEFSVVVGKRLRWHHAQALTNQRPPKWALEVHGVMQGSWSYAVRRNSREHGWRPAANQLGKPEGVAIPCDLVVEQVALVSN